MGLGAFLGPRLGVADVVEVDAVDVVFLRHLGTDVGQIVARLRIFGVHEAVLLDAARQLGVLALELLEAWFADFADGDCDYPGVTLHASAVTLVDDELQRIVSGMLAVGACQAEVERFNL